MHVNFIGLERRAGGAMRDAKSWTKKLCIRIEGREIVIKESKEIGFLWQYSDDILKEKP